MATPPLTIRKFDTLVTRLANTEANTLQQATASGAKAETAIRINGKALAITVTPSVQPNRVYTLYYIDGKRTAKGAVADRLLAVAS
jgi:hypothetical protein